MGYSFYQTYQKKKKKKRDILNNPCASCVKVNVGVLQGSLLGLVLFLVKIPEREKNSLDDNLKKINR